VEYETGVTRVDPKAFEDAAIAYEKSRMVYLERARELAKARRRTGKIEDPTKSESKAKGDAASGEDHAGDKKATGAGTHASGAAVGSIDLDAVLKRYAKVRRSEEQLHAVSEDYKERLAKLASNSRAIMTEMKRFAPNSADYRGLEDQLATTN